MLHPPTWKVRCRCPHKTAPVHRPSPLSPVTGSTHANNRSARSPRPKPEGPARDDPPRGLEQVRRGACPAPLPLQGPAAGTKSPVLGRPQRAPRSHPVEPGATTPGMGEGTTATNKPTGTPRATGPDESRHTNAGPRGTPERHAAGHYQGTRTGANPQRPPGAANPGSAHNTQRTAAQERVPRTAEAPGPAHRAHGQWVVGPGRTPERTRGRGWESARFRTPHTQARSAPPWRPRAALTARKSARCGVGDGSPRPHPPHQQPVGSGPPPHARKDEWSGVGERPTPDAPHPGKRRPIPGTLMPPPQRAKPARKSARCGGGDGSPSPHPLHSQPVGSGPRPHARKDEWSGVGERPTPDAPHPGKRRPPRAPSCRPHSAQSQLERARAVGFVTGPHARSPRTHSQWVGGPGRTPARTSGRGWESARPRTPHTQARGAPPGHPHAALTARKASSQECALWGR